MSLPDGPLLVLGATSDIGGELARHLAAGRDVVLAARRTSALGPLCQDLRRRGARSVHTVGFEATDLAATSQVLAGVVADMGQPPAIAAVCFGILGDQARAERDEQHTAEIATVDYTAQLAALTVLAREMPRGVIVAFSSIAGWRARRANYVYGSTKAGLDAFCQGLSDALAGRPLRLLTVRPGFVIGHMTEGMSPAPLSVYPEDVAEAVVAELRGGTHSATLWVPRRLRALAWVMRLVPRPVWRRMPR